MAVAVQAQRRTPPARSKTERTPASACSAALPGRPQIVGNEVVRQQPVARLLAEAGGVEARPRAERPLLADRVDARNQAARPFEH